MLLEEGLNRQRRRRVGGRHLAVALGAVLIAMDLFASSYFYNMAVARGPKDFLKKDSALTQLKGAKVFKLGHAWLEKQRFEPLVIRSFDGLTLRGYYLPAPVPTTRTVILAHGYFSKAKRMGAFARYYHDVLGYNVLLPDARGHGTSEGAYIGYGWHDRLDIKQWIDVAVRKAGQDAQIVLHGVSMGGATVTMASGEVLPPQVKAVVSDCAFTSAQDVLTYQLGRMYHLPPFPLVPSISLMTKLRAGYSFDEASALSQVRKTRLPMLFIHGGSDSFVPTEMVHRLYEACPTDKELLVVPNAEHGVSIELDTAGYEHKVEMFLAKHAP